MNSYQRRQRKRRMLFGFRKLGAAAERAARSLGVLAESAAMLSIGLAHLKNTEKPA